MEGGKSGNNMIMIGAAIVIVIIIVAGAVLLTGSKVAAPKSTTGSPSSSATTTALTTAPGGTSTVAASTYTTTAAPSGGSSTFASWEGKNLSLSTFSQDLGQATFAKLTLVNATYDFNVSVAEGANTTKLNGLLTQELYKNSSRTATNLTYSGYHIQAVSIYNASSHKSYTCSGYGGSYTCYASTVNESIGNGNSAINYAADSGGANATVTGYFSNIQVSDSSINGQSCTLVTGDLYIDSVSTNGSYVLSGTLNACISTKTNLSLETSLVGTTKSTSKGSTNSGSFNYTETWVKSGPAPTASITALPGPITTV